MKQKTHSLNQCHPRVGEKVSVNGCLPSHVLEKGLKDDRVENSIAFPSDSKSNQLYEPMNLKSLKEKGGGKSKKQDTLLNRVAKHVGVDPKDQHSLLQKLPLSEQEKVALAGKWLRPPQPASWKEDPDKWLDSNNIRDVMTQYEEAFPSFKFLGPYPIDFAAAADSTATSPGTDTKNCLIPEMCQLDLDEAELKGKEHIGIVYNLDPHYKSGSHWVANYINIPKKICYYFDSYGMKPPKQIYKFMQWLSIQEPDIQLGWNGRRFQFQNSECGMYCLYFIDRMIAGEDFLKFCRRAPPDSFMLDLRDNFFST